VQGIVRPPVGWSYRNFSSTWQNKSWNDDWFKYDTGIAYRFLYRFRCCLSSSKPVIDALIIVCKQKLILLREEKLNRANNLNLLSCLRKPMTCVIFEGNCEYIYSYWISTETQFQATIFSLKGLKGKLHKMR
jgi:hypothetical protein